MDLFFDAVTSALVGSMTLLLVVSLCWSAAFVFDLFMDKLGLIRKKHFTKSKKKSNARKKESKRQEKA